MGCTHELSREGAEVACAASDAQDAHARAQTKVLEHLRVDMRSAVKKSRCSIAAGASKLLMLLVEWRMTFGA
jgi:hypothetical protein